MAVFTREDKCIPDCLICSPYCVAKSPSVTSVAPHSPKNRAVLEEGPALIWGWGEGGQFAAQYFIDNHTNRHTCWDSDTQTDTRLCSKRV